METMDFPLHWTLDFLQDILPPETVAQVQNFLLNPSSPLHNLRRHLAAAAAHMYPLVAAALGRLTELLSASPNVVAAAVILALAVLVMQILSFVHRLVLFWTRVAFRLLFWAAVGLLVSVAWQRGWERTLRDVVVLGSQLVGWVAGVVDLWVREYERAQAQAQAQSRSQSRSQSQRRYGDYQHW